jgi:hypothetical protein
VALGSNQLLPPTAQALSGEVAAVPSRKPGSDDLVQRVPFQCMISEPDGLRPTAQMSLAETAATLYSRPGTTDPGDVPVVAASAAAPGAATLSARPATAVTHACRNCLRVKAIHFPL